MSDIAVKNLKVISEPEQVVIDGEFDDYYYEEDIENEAARHQQKRTWNE